MKSKLLTFAMRKLLIVALLMNGIMLAERLVQDLTASAAPPRVARTNGDTNGDGLRDLSDAVYMLNWLFAEGPPPVAFAQSGGSNAELLKTLGSLQEEVTTMDGEMTLFQKKFDTFDDSIGVAEEVVVQWGEVSEHLKDGKRDEFFSFVEVTDEEIAFCGVNVRICNGMNATQSKNGRGNLIVGYNEESTYASSEVRPGSHNVVVGAEHVYREDSCVLVGHKNSSGHWAHTEGVPAAVFGTANSVTRSGSTITGGAGNHAFRHHSAVSGGRFQVSILDYMWRAGGKIEVP